MNRTVIFVTFAALAGVGILGFTIILILRPDASATYTALLTTILGLVTLAAGQFYGFGKTQEQIKQVEVQTNGTLSRRDETIERLQGLLLEAGIDHRAEPTRKE